MKATINKIIGHSTDYWVCEKCNGLNWYENEVCTGENSGTNCKDFKPTPMNLDGVEHEEMKVLNWVDAQLEFYKEEMDYTDDDCDNIEIYI